MAILYFFIVALIYVIKAQFTKVCVSGMYSTAFAQRINGEYDFYMTTGQGYPAYRKINTCDSDDPYMYVYKFGVYYIGQGPVGTNTNSHAFCNDGVAFPQNNVFFPEQCKSWKCSSSDDCTALNVVVGPCPVTTCDTLTVETATPNLECTGNLDFAGPNLYSASNGYFLNFNVYEQRWICVEERNIDECGASFINSQRDGGFNNFSMMTSQAWQYGSSSNPSFTTFNFGCQGYRVSLSPTKATSEPTRNPVPQGVDSELCLFGNGDSIRAVNGAYRYQGMFNGLPYYAKTNTDDDCPAEFGSEIYLYYVAGSDNNSTWFVGVNLGQSWEKLIYGLCRNFDVGNDPTNCGQNWHFGEFSSAGGNLPKTDALLTAIPCPIAPCSRGITWDFTGCPGPFTERIVQSPVGQPYPIVWRNPNTDYYLYFNENKFIWECAELSEFKMRECTNPLIVAQTHAFYPFTGTSTNPISFIDRSPTQPPYSRVDATIRCYTGSNAPSVSPVAEPTPTPTRNPLRPGQTGGPTSSPMKSPTVSPVKAPTETPSMNPTMKPTESPYLPGTPSRAPSKETVIPTSSPLDSNGNIPSLPTSSPIAPTSSPIAPTSTQGNDITLHINVYIISLVLCFSLLLI